MNAGKRVLIIDDEPDLLDVLSEGLSELGYVVETSQWLDIAEELIWTRHYDCVVVDIIIGADSKNLDAYIKKMESLPGTPPFVLISGDPERLTGFNSYNNIKGRAEKPFTIEQLHKLMEQAIADSAPQRFFKVAFDAIIKTNDVEHYAQATKINESALLLTVFDEPRFKEKDTVHFNLETALPETTLQGCEGKVKWLREGIRQKSKDSRVQVFETAIKPANDNDLKKLLNSFTNQ